MKSHDLADDPVERELGRRAQEKAEEDDLRQRMDALAAQEKMQPGARPEWRGSLQGKRRSDDLAEGRVEGEMGRNAREQTDKDILRQRMDALAAQDAEHRVVMERGTVKKAAEDSVAATGLTRKEVHAITDNPVGQEKLRVGDLSERTEAERLEHAAEQVSKIEELRPEVWAGLTETQREWQLREVGQRLSEAYECPAPPFIGSHLPKSDGGVLLGAHSDPEYQTRLNRDLLRENDPAEALGTYCHEFRHAYQHEMVARYKNPNFRHLCHDETRAAQWADNLREGYVRFETDPAGYEAQAVEKDANDFARRLTEAVKRKQLG
jgi:hypothetical protein